MKTAIYAFSGDPITYGHIDVITRATQVFDEVTVAIGINPEKDYMFSLHERTCMAEKSLQGIPRVKVVSFEGLLVDYAFEHNIPVIIKGLRNSKDFDYELILHQMSKSQQLDIDTFFLPAKQDLIHISSSSAKALQLEQGLIDEYVPLYVKQCLEAKVSNQYIIGVTGEIGSGKSYLCRCFEQIGKACQIEVHNIELDHIGHQILGNLEEPLYRKVRAAICGKFGAELKNADDTIDRKKLGEIVFNDARKMAELNHLIYPSLLLRLRRDLYLKKGIILFNAALIAETSLEHLCNNNVVLVTVNKKTQRERLYRRQLSNEQIEKRIKSQFSTDKKLRKLQQKINADCQGKLWIVDNSDESGNTAFSDLFQELVCYLDQFGELRLKAVYKKLGIEKDFKANYEILVKAYARNKRFYHTLSYILDCITELDNVKKLLINHEIAACALWYSRVVFDPLQNNCIEQSAVAAYNTFARAGLPAEFCNKVAYYIRCLVHNDVYLKDDAGYIADIDLIILGKSLQEFEQYEKNLRREYNWMENNAYLNRRSDFYRRLLARPQIFFTEHYKEKYEAAARHNLKAFLESRGNGQ